MNILVNDKLLQLNYKNEQEAVEDLSQVYLSGQIESWGYKSQCASLPHQGLLLCMSTCAK